MFDFIFEFDNNIFIMTILKKLVGFLLLLNFVAEAQVTSDIVGYETINIKSGQYNHMGVRLLESVELTGTIDWDGATFTTAADLSSLVADAPYQLEINSGDNKGVVIAVELNAGGTGLVIHPIYASSVIASFTGQEYKLRKAATIDSIMGADNKYGLAGTSTGNTASSDLVYINFNGEFQSFVYVDIAEFEGWYDTGDYSEKAGDTPILSTTALVIEKRSSGDQDVVIAGNVKSTATYFTLGPAYNQLSSVYPAGVTLSNSGLSDYISENMNGNFSSSDHIVIISEDGSYASYAYNSSFGWFDGNFNNSDDVELTSSITVYSHSVTDSIIIADRNYN